MKNEATFKVSIKIVIQSSLRNLHWRATLLPLFVTSNYVMKIDTHIRVCTAKVDFVIHFAIGYKIFTSGAGGQSMFFNSFTNFNV